MSLQLLFLFPFGIDLYGKRQIYFTFLTNIVTKSKKTVTFVARKADSYVPVPIIFLQNIFINI